MAEQMSKVEQLAAANVKPVAADPMAEWDAAVAERMAIDGCARDVAVDRILARTSWGSALWNRANMWWAAQPHVVEENGRQVRTGNWLNSGTATGRRIPRKP